MTETLASRASCFFAGVKRLGPQSRATDFGPNGGDLTVEGSVSDHVPPHANTSKSTMAVCDLGLVAGDHKTLSFVADGITLGHSSTILFS